MPTPTRRRGGWLAPTLVALSGLASPADAKELHWRELAVEARLEADGRLVVSERHAMVFTGDWNGGERQFRLAMGQEIDLDGVYRLNPATGEWRAMQEGDLDDVDRWDWADSRTLRWRSREPSDPQFDSTEIGYRIDYTLSGILQRRGSAWVLDHDFAFPDRDGAIERFRLDLELAPEWSLTSEGARGLLHHEVGPLPPGSSRVVTLELAFAGAAAPTHAAPERLPLATRAGVLGGAALAALALQLWARRRERAVGRLAPLESLAGIDRAWIEANLLTLPPEEVGAAWDENVGAAEVAAMLARLQLEKKISSKVEEKGTIFKRANLHLTLDVPRDSLSEAERSLVDGLFPSGDTTDTEALRKHYKTSGFDPAAKIRQTLVDQVGRRRGFAGTRPRPSRLPSVLLIVAGALGIVAAAIAKSGAGVIGAFVGIALVVTWVPGFVAAFVHRNRVVGFGGPNFTMAFSAVAGLGIVALLALIPAMALVTLIAGAVLFVGLARTIATALQTRQGAERIARRRELARARAWLDAELRKEAPALDDAWVPYLVAFGLAPSMDRWFKSHGGTAASTIGTSRSGGGWSSGSGGGGGSSWTGGGGSFGGAGATAAWAGAATAMSSGVAAASSGSSGGGGGGGSSGGGGGGGW